MNHHNVKPLVGCPAAPGLPDIFSAMYLVAAQRLLLKMPAPPEAGRLAAARNTRTHAE
jgi:hypothetical protein